MKTNRIVSLAMAGSIAGFGLISPSPAWAQEPTGTFIFEDVGQVCLGKEEKSRLVARLRELTIGEDQALTLSASSDAVEMRREGWSGSSTCVSSEIPAMLTGHQRIAALRAAHVLEIGRVAKLPVFSRPPIYVVEGSEPIIGRDPRFITIVIRKEAEHGARARRVEVITTDAYPEESREPTTTKPPEDIPDPTPSGGSPGPIDLGPAAPRGNDSGRDALGWTSVTLGAASVALGASFMIAAKVQGDSAGFAVDRAHADALDADARSYAHAGGWALGIGAALGAVGAVLLATAPTDAAARAQTAKPRSSDISLSASPGGLRFSW